MKKEDKFVAEMLCYVSSKENMNVRYQMIGS